MAIREVLPLVAGAFFLQIAIGAHDGDTAFLALRAVFYEKWIGEDQAEALARITGQRVGTGLDRTRVAVHAVQKEIHHAQASRIGNQFPAAVSGTALAAGSSKQMLFLILVHVVVVDDEINRFQQEAAGAAWK